MADVVAFVPFLAVPLAVGPVLVDPFTGVKWYVLELLAIVWVLVEGLARQTMPWPTVVRRHAKPLVALAVLTTVNSLRTGLAWAVEPFLARATFVALVWCSYAYFSRNGLRTHAIRAALTVSSTVVIAVGLAQVLGLTRAMDLEPLLGLAGGDGRSATFGNANMAAQFVGFALAFLVASRATDHSRARVWPRRASGALVAAGLGYMVLAGARSATLAVAVAFVVIAGVAGRHGRRATGPHLLLGAILAVLVAGATGWGSGAALFLDAAPHPVKAESLRVRQRLWIATLELIRDRPLGAGAGNFVHAFLPYQLKDERLRSEAVVYASPHNELLRALAEEGLAWCALAGGLMLGLGVAVVRRARSEGWPSTAVVLAAGGAFLMVESAFQFPFSMAFGSLGAAVLLGLALAFVERDHEPPRLSANAPMPGRCWLAAVAAALIGGLALGRLVASDYLAATDREHAPRQRRACALNPRDVRTCLTAAWLDARAGRRRRARVRASAILYRSPYYYPAIKLLADESFAQGGLPAGCFHLWIYDSLFRGRSLEHERLLATCRPDLLEAFRAHGPAAGYDRFPLTVPAGPSGAR